MSGFEPILDRSDSIGGPAVGATLPYPDCYKACSYITIYYIVTISDILLQP